MAHKISARELKWIRQKYSRMSDDELLQVKLNRIIPEAQEILSAELLGRGWNEQKIDARRRELEEHEEESSKVLNLHTTGETSGVPFVGKVFLFFGGGEILYGLKTLGDPFVSS